MTEQEVKQIYNSSKWKQVREWILRRDRYECQDCIARLRKASEENKRLYGEEAKIRRATEVHHIKELRAYPGKAFDEENLISLCTQCHNIRHGRYPKKFTVTRKEKFKERW